jgi:hypothetical protein
MSIQQEIILRYRSDGHVRFQLPALLCQKYTALNLQQAIEEIDGVYHAQIFRRRGKLAIHFSHQICSFGNLAKQLFEILEDLKKKGHLDNKNLNRDKPKQTFTQSLKGKIKNLRVSQWTKEKYTDTKDTAKAMGILAKLGIKNKSGILKDPEKTMVNFFNDVLVLYLIKTHWHLITQHWILKPFRNRYHWITIFYLMYLLVRSRMPKNK